MSNSYHCNIQNLTGPDSITLEELDHSGPKTIITIYNGFNPVIDEDYEISSYNTKSLYNLILHKNFFNPLTREPFDKNQITRIKWYNECLDKYPTITHDDIKDYKELIIKWLEAPLEDNEHTEKVKYFITYDQIIDFFGFKEIDSREKAEQYFIDNPDKTWAIRKSSVVDTKYNQFFVIMTKNGNIFNNYLYVHRQGYGICGVNAKRFDKLSSVILNKTYYYTNICELLITLFRNNTIELL